MATTDERYEKLWRSLQDDLDAQIELFRGDVMTAAFSGDGPEAVKRAIHMAARVGIRGFMLRMEEETAKCEP